MVLDKCGVVTDALLHKTVVNTNDGVHNYSRVLCHYAALSGEIIIRCWRIFLHFRVNGRTTLQFQLATIRPSLVHQLTWGRFINTHGRYIGRNIPRDLFNMSTGYLRMQYKEWVQS